MDFIKTVNKNKEVYGNWQQKVNFNEPMMRSALY